ncbi:hypothetical protein DPMN_192577 [Dreissena polymorpha]|uniref:Uncharacterized protein n=1 Tax=Dreissena polymorpha TaxID=45954 RepID=A0A9D3Y7D4_DREPO|nr:hypothetical protein DPMN_192577 [Dreissena polymorpha]
MASSSVNVKLDVSATFANILSVAHKYCKPLATIETSSFTIPVTNVKLAALSLPNLITATIYTDVRMTTTRHNHRVQTPYSMEHKLPNHRRSTISAALSSTDNDTMLTSTGITPILTQDVSLS